MILHLKIIYCVSENWFQERKGGDLGGEPLEVAVFRYWHFAVVNNLSPDSVIRKVFSHKSQVFICTFHKVYYKWK